MTKLIIHDLDRNEQIDDKAMASVTGGSADWVFGWITPHGGAGAGGVNLYNPLFNVQYANQTIINEGDGTINAVNAPSFTPTTNLTENNFSSNIQAQIENTIGSR